MVLTSCGAVCACPPDVAVDAAGAGLGEVPPPLRPPRPPLPPFLLLPPSSTLLPGWPRRRRAEEPDLALVASPGVNAGAEADSPGPAPPRPEAGASLLFMLPYFAKMCEDIYICDLLLGAFSSTVGPRLAPTISPSLAPAAKERSALWAR